jgi:hypothetical protein
MLAQRLTREGRYDNRRLLKIGRSTLSDNLRAYVPTHDSLNASIPGILREARNTRRC